jgi:hypothetical protein
LNEIGDDPDQLPVLQHVLMRTWQEAKGEDDVQLAHYEATGGVANAISRHADDVFAKLASDEQRRIAERMFKAISEQDRRGRAIRRPLPFADVVAIADAPAESVTRAVEAFRAPDCCFLMPPAGQPLNEKTPLDISHESLLRGWKKMTGERQGEGWLAEEDRDGKTYRSLVDAAESFETDPTAVLPRALTRQRDTWWKRKQPNAAWAERYGNRFELVSELLRQSARRQRIVRSVAGVAIIVMTAVIGYIIYDKINDWRAEGVRVELTARNALNHEFQKQYEQIVAEAAARKQEIDALQQQIVDLREQLQARGIQTRTDETAQQVAAVAGIVETSTSSATTDQDGYMWVGSVQKSNLTQNNQQVPPPQVRRNEKYFTVPLSIFLRAGLPDENYVQQPSVGVVAPYSRVQALEAPVSYERPTGRQYWLKVRVLTPISLPTVYFQYAAAPKTTTAQALSQKLRAIGYRLPGEERVDAAQGRREVRYFYAADKDDAEQLAQDTTKALADIGLPDKPAVTTRSMQDFSGKKNAPGVLELWLDMTASKAAAK